MMCSEGLLTFSVAGFKPTEQQQPPPQNQGYPGTQVAPQMVGSQMGSRGASRPDGFPAAAPAAGVPEGLPPMGLPAAPTGASPPNVDFLPATIGAIEMVSPQSRHLHHSLKCSRTTRVSDRLVVRFRGSLRTVSNSCKCSSRRLRARRTRTRRSCWRR